MNKPDIRQHHTSAMAQDLKRWLEASIVNARAECDIVDPEDLKKLQGRIEAWKELYAAIYHGEIVVTDVNPYL